MTDWIDDKIDREFAYEQGLKDKRIQALERALKEAVEALGMVDMGHDTITSGKYEEQSCRRCLINKAQESARRVLS